MVLLKDIIGHDEIVKTLTGALISGRVAHAYLFSGPRGVGKQTTALAFARALVCSRPSGGDGCAVCDSCSRLDRGIHPEVRVIRPDGTTVKIGQVRQLAAGVRLGPEGGGRAVRIVDEADTMTAEAANSLLKTLEEPLPGVVVILITTRPQAILPTILSRCQHIYFQPLLKHQLVRGLAGISGEPRERLLLAASLAGGSLGRALELLSGGLEARDRAGRMIRDLAGAGVEEALALAAGVSAEREEVAPLLDMIILWLRDILLYNETGDPGHLINADRLDEISILAGRYTTGRLLDMIAGTDSARARLSSSANVQLALEALFLSLAGIGPGGDRREEVV